MKETIIEAKGISRSFPIHGGEIQVLKNIDLAVPRNTLTILKGRSGSGKTTLQNILGALDIPTGGSVFYENVDIIQKSERERELLRRRQIGFVFQSVSLIPIMSAFENVEFALRLAGVKQGREERAAECLNLVGLGSRMNHMPQEMSGGEQQRVAIARAMAHRPKVIFADEPTAELDTVTGLNIIRLFKEMIAKEDITVIMTTHDVGHMSIGDVVYEIDDGHIIGCYNHMEEKEM